MSKHSLSSRERLLAALNGESPDCLPFSPFLAYLWESLPQAVQDRGQLAYLQSVGADPLWRGAPCGVRAIQTGVTTRIKQDARFVYRRVETPVGTLTSRHAKSAAGNTSFLIEHPLKTARDFQVQLWIEEHTRHVVDLSAAEAHLTTDGREGLSLGMLIPRAKSAFQLMVEHLVGTEELIYALADYPEQVDALWRRMVANDLVAARLSLEAPYQYFITWEDSGTQNYSPRLYDRYIGSEIGQWCALLAEDGRRYIQHACGAVRDLVVRMRDHGAHGIESISPPPTGNVSIADARARVGADFAIVGGIEPTRLLNTPLEDLGAYAEQVIAEGAGGPFVLANSDSCPPGVTRNKFARLAEVAHAHRD